MEIVFGKADLKDINCLVRLRLDYLKEDYGELTSVQVGKMKESLPLYYAKHINQDLFVYVARVDEIISISFLLVTEKPANPSFINGKTGTLLNVYTKPEYRRKGIARELLKMLLMDAKEMGLDYVELKSTEAGYSLYKSIGFEENIIKYHNMKMVLN